MVARLLGRWLDPLLAAPAAATRYPLRWCHRRPRRRWRLVACPWARLAARLAWMPAPPPPRGPAPPAAALPRSGASSVSHLPSSAEAGRVVGRWRPTGPWRRPVRAAASRPQRPLLSPPPALPAACLPPPLLGRASCSAPLARQAASGTTHPQWLTPLSTVPAPRCRPPAAIRRPPRFLTTQKSPAGLQSSPSAAMAAARPAGLPIHPWIALPTLARCPHPPPRLPVVAVAAVRLRTPLWARRRRRSTPGHLRRTRKKLPRRLASRPSSMPTRRRTRRALVKPPRRRMTGLRWN